MVTIRIFTLAALLTAAPMLAQEPNDPFPDPIAATDGRLFLMNKHDGVIREVVP